MEAYVDGFPLCRQRYSGGSCTYKARKFKTIKFLWYSKIYSDLTSYLTECVPCDLQIEIHRGAVLQHWSVPGTDDLFTDAFLFSNYSMKV